MEKILTGDDVLLIKKTNIVRDYKKDAKEGFAGKSYRIYAFGQDAFAVHQDDDFHQDLKDGNIQKVMVTVTEEGWSLANYITWKQANNAKRNQVVYDSITVENVKIDFNLNTADLI